MATRNQIGPKRVVVGAHYGLRDWLAQLATFVTLLSLFYHAWVGIRDIWMDYVKPVGVRLFLQAATFVWLLACAGYAAQILWRV
jgi:succinate dehydrogenase / fumarate reductase membrane anchor subunit